MPTTTTQSSRSRTQHQPLLTMPVTLPGGWQLNRIVSTGQLTEVYQARHADGPRDAAPAYAVKLLRTGWEQNDDAVTLLRREVAVTSLVASPHLIPSLAQHIEGPPFFVVYPWLSGHDLAKQLARHGRPSTAAAIWFARQVATALDHIHRADWTHGDVKPANILVTADGHATLLDLGFARRIGDAGSGLDRAVMGTPNYLAPEMLHSRSRADVRSDLYALGVTLFELLTGALPHADADRSAPVARPTSVHQVRALNAAVPLACGELLKELLAPDPIRRPQTARELIDRLISIEIATLADR